MCGPGRTGKSSLLRSLLRQAFQDGSDSTIGVELEKIFCRIVKHCNQYIWELSHDTYAQQLELTRKAVGHAVQIRRSNVAHTQSRESFQRGALDYESSVAVKAGTLETPTTSTSIASIPKADIDRHIPAKYPEIPRIIPIFSLTPEIPNVTS